MLNFRGDIPGTHGPFQTDPPRLQVTRTKYFGLVGEEEIVGKRGGRTVDYDILLHSPGFTSAQSLTAFLEYLDTLVGVNDVLVETGTVQRVFVDCTFEGFVPKGGMLPDSAGTLETTAGTWFIPGVLRWHQLTVV